MTLDEIKAHLPEVIAERLQSAKAVDGIATVILESSGLSEDQRGAIERGAKEALSEVDGITEVRVAMVASRTLRRIIAVGSGKGGVGKSTLTANLAVALAKMGRKVGVVDADVYGPSQPTLLGAKSKPIAENEKLVPVISDAGIPVLSMGQLIEPGKALAWRGPMAGSAMGQLVDAQWGDTEVLLIDLPPGTGDVQLSLMAKFKPAGAVIVSTPQDLALIDAQRAAQLFEHSDVPIIGLVENMSGYECPHCHEVSDPFGRGGVENAASGTGIPFLGRIPLAMAIREASDVGQPPAAGDAVEGEAFTAIAAKLASWLDGGKV
ncbi:Mrp/NBP35 family ATP-binding protein [Altererythrobacter sp. ZODW24]|uniref:Mrp/NBP35 family ATP-binding protein n=1 Tax=Altererythrobacter sp. ZODW24 TaxID=2185142 RepID=UPI000DF7CD25|nr:Mrp/NBP35 family ATP-binding protein [Altererythrobacter sp. ZODW24]